MESWIDGTRFRCGPLAKAAMQFAATEGVESDPPRGVDALITLARAIERHRRHGDSDGDDRVFVEGAGAFFAATLADTLGSGAHIARGNQHRLRLGRFGCFDPFASIELALDAPNTKRCLVEQTALAEAYAGDRAAQSMVVAELLRQLTARHGSASLLECFDGELVVQAGARRLSLRIASLVAECEQLGTASIEAAVKRMLAGPEQAMAPSIEWSDLSPRILPRLLSERFVAELPANDLVTRPLGAGVELGFIVRVGARGRYLRARDLGERDGREALSASLYNLAGRSSQAKLSRVETDAGPLVTAHSGDGLDSSRLILPGLHDVLAPELGSPMLAAVPHRDALYLAPAEPRSARALQLRSGNEAARSRYSITDQLFEVHPAGRLRPLRG